MARRLADVDVQYISLVKKGANGEKVTIYKSDDFDETDLEKKEEVTEEVVEKELTEEEVQKPVMEKAEITNDDGGIKKFYNVMKNFFGGQETIEKAKDINTEVNYTSFTSQIKNVRRNCYKAVYTLENVISEIFWSDVDNGKELINKAIDEFKAHVNTILNDDGTVQKSFFSKEAKDQDHIEVMKSLTETLNNNIQKSKGVDDEVNKEEIQALLEPITKSIGAISTKLEEFEGLSAKVEKMEEQVAGDKEELVEKTEETATETKTEVQKSLEAALAPIVKSLEGISERVIKIEETRGASTQGDGQEVVKKEDEEWAGILFKD